MRGTESEIGTERVSANGYRYRKISNGKWILVHRLMAEEMLERELHESEYASFKDGDRTNFDPSNIVVLTRGARSLKKRQAQLTVRIQELQAALADVNSRLEVRESLGSDVE